MSSYHISVISLFIRDSEKVHPINVSPFLSPQNPETADGARRDGPASCHQLDRNIAFVVVGRVVLLILLYLTTLLCSSLDQEKNSALQPSTQDRHYPTRQP
jgi:hypothetical protein